MDGEVINITINENETLMALLNRMLNIKNENNKDVECVFNGNTLTTKDCTNIQQLFVKNSSVIFNEYENDRASLLNTSDMNEVIDRFKSRGKRYDANDQEKEKIASDIRQKENEFNKLINELDTLDFSKSVNVFQWLNSTIPYINNIDLYLPVGFENIEYATMANYIVKKLEEKGYTTELGPINNLDDYYKRLINYQLNDLDKYGFFAYEYADNLKEQDVKTEEEPVNEQEEIIETSQEQEIETNNVVEDNIINEEVVEESPEVATEEVVETEEVQEEATLNTYNLEVNEDEKIITTLKKMWKTKVEQNQEVLCTKNGIEYSTEGCNSITELYTKYNEAFFNEYETVMNKIIADEVIQKAINNFSEENIAKNLDKLQQQSDNSSELEAECNELQNMDIDFTNPKEVNNWLYNLSTYINKPYINIINDIDANTFYYRSNTILARLKQNGYTTEVSTINTTDDFYRKMIAEKMTELEKYHFFVKDYAEQIQKENVQEPTNEEAQPEVTYANETVGNEQIIKNNNDKKILAIQLYRQGRIDKAGNITKSFADRKQEIQLKLDELDNIKDKPVDIRELFFVANSEIDEQIIGNPENMNNTENAINAYQIATELPDQNRIMKAYEEAIKLPTDNQVRNLLIDAITKLNIYYNENNYTEESLNEAKEQLANVFNQNEKYKATEQEQQVIQKYGDFMQTGDTTLIDSVLESVVLLPKTSQIKEPIFEVLQNMKKTELKTGKEVISKINELQQQYQALEQEEQARIAKTEKKLNILQGKEEEKDDSNDKDNNNNNSGSGNSRDENEEYIKKLQSVGQVSVDLERRLDEKDSWMELNTAIALKRLKDDEIEPADKEPHFITKVEKAGIELIEKIRSIDFKAGVKKVLEFMKKNANAVALSVAFLATAAIGTSINNMEAEASIPEVSMETEFNTESNTALEQTIENAIDNKEEINLAAETETVQENISNEEITEPTLENEVQEAKENILNGASVYRTAANAMSDTNPLTPSSKQLANSWENATVGSYYTMDNGKLESLSEEEAQTILSNGGQVVVGMENNGTGIGYVSLDQQETGKTL